MGNSGFIKRGIVKNKAKTGREMHERAGGQAGVGTRDRAEGTARSARPAGCTAPRRARPRRSPVPGLELGRTPYLAEGAAAPPA